MYRCVSCDTPAQPGCGCIALSFDKQDPPDVWGWEEEPIKLDINAGVRVHTTEELEET